MLVGVALLGLVTDLSVVAWADTRLAHATDAATHAALACYDRDTWAAEHRIVLDPACAQSKAAQYLGRNMPGAALERVTVSPADKVTVQASATAPRVFAVLWGERAVTLRSLSSAIRRSG